METAIDRRKFLKKSSMAATAAVAGIAAAATLGGVAAIADQKKTKRRYAMLIDLRRCKGCDTCTVSCKAEFNVRLGAFRSWVNKVEKGSYPNVKRYFLPKMCNHCANSSCSLVCPTGATYEREDGVVVIDKDKCIGCRYCINACPYGARYFNWSDDKSGSKSRTHGTVDKCDMCAHRIDKGLVPSCVNGCPENARIFGDINDPDSEISFLLAKNAVNTLFPEKGTEPHVFYIGLEESVVKGGMEGGR